MNIKEALTEFYIGFLIGVVVAGFLGLLIILMVVVFGG